MKFAIITDSHMGPSPFYFGTNRIMSYMSEVVVSELIETINKEPGLAFLAQLGDMAQDDVRYPSVDFDRANYTRARWYFNKSKVPVYHAVGNHDRENLTYEDLCELLGYKTLHFSFDADDVHCVFLYTRHFHHQDMVVEEDQLRWLKEDLARTTKKTLIFTHHPLADHDLTGSFWFEGKGNKALVKNREEVRAILEASGKVIGVFNGHLHRNYKTVHQGIPYHTIQSCVEDVAGDGKPSRAYAIVSVEGSKVSVEVRGGDPVRF